MSYAALMIYVDADSVSRERIRLATDLADKFSATLIGLSALVIRSPVMAEGVSVAAATAADLQEMEARLAAAGKSFRTFAGERANLEWRQVMDFPDDALPREARSADLVIVGQRRGLGNAFVSLDTANAVLGAGRPTLVVPEGVTSLKAEHVVIGWKDTREARRAVQDALPFCHEAAHVTVVELCEAGNEGLARARVADVARHLLRHRIKARPEVVLERGTSGAAQLVDFAREHGSDLLVTGAYGHSRLGEWVFGGMTRELLRSSPLCCLMSH